MGRGRVQQWASHSNLKRQRTLLDLVYIQVVNVIRSHYNHLSMIIKSEPALSQDIQDIQPPPEYTETLPRPEPTHAQQSIPATQPHYPPQPPTPRSRDNLSPAERQARIGQEYRDRSKPSSLRPSSLGPQNLHAVLAQCAIGNHDATTTFGICGIVCSILLFPIGLLCLW